MKNDRGVAIMMVLTAITLLTAIMIAFTYDTKVNKFKVINMQDRVQARLNAESGLTLALVRLELYKEAFNRRENNDNAKQLLTINVLNQIWQYPFMYPIPALPGMLGNVKSSVEKFNKESLLTGSFSLNITNITNRFNLSGMRLSRMAMKGSKDPTDMLKKRQLFTQNFIDFVTQIIQKKRNDVSNFDPSIYLNSLPEIVANLNYYIDEKDLPNIDYKSAMNDFYAQNLTSKHAPLSSMSELYLIPKWDDGFIEMLADDITVHTALAPSTTGEIQGMSVMDLNQLTPKMISFLFEDYSGQIAEDYKRLKNDPRMPVFFNTVDDFKAFATNQLRISGDRVENAIKKQEANGTIFQSYPSLFEVTSVGTYGRTSYTIKAIVATQVQIPTPAKSDQQLCEDTKNAIWQPNFSPQCKCPDGMDYMNKVCFPQGTTPPTATASATNTKTQLLPPKVLELIVL